MMPIHTNDDLYMNAANTPLVYGATIKKTPVVIHDKNYIKSHIQVIAPVEYTNKLPTGAMIIVYALMGVVLLSLIIDGYCVIRDSYRTINKWLTSDTASCNM
jgi:hypothetical protein